MEAVGDNGFTVGVSYVPVRELGAKSRTDATPTTGDDEMVIPVHTLRKQS